MKLYKYTPALLYPKTLEDTLIGRDIELDNLKRILKSASAGKSFSNPILVGPKGIGKSHLLRILYYSLRGEIKTKGLNAYKDKFIPVIFSEEEYPGNITKFIKLTLQYLDELEIAGIPPIPEELISPRTLNEKEKEIAVDYLKQFKKKTGKILLLLVDNLNDIIERFTDEDQSSLREVLMTYDSLLLVGSAPTLFDSIINHDRPFYNFFEIIWLKDLSFEDNVSLLKRYAELDERTDLREKLEESEAKLKALHELAGGNPRLILSLYHIIAEGDITSVEETFIKLLDELSPYFRERIRYLSEQQKEIIDVMAKAEGLLTPTEIAACCYIPVNVVLSQIKRLEKIGYIKIAKKLPKKVFYDFNERLFRHWRQMRVEAGKKRLRFIVKFLETWFTKEELFTYLDKTLYEMRERLSSDNTKIQHDIDKLWYLKEAVPEYRGRDEMCVACAREDYDVGLKITDKALIAKPHDTKILTKQACLYNRLGKSNESIEACKKAIEKKPDMYEAWSNLGDAYKEIKRYNEAIEAYKKVIEIKPDMHEAWHMMGNMYVNLKKYIEASVAFKKAIDLKSDASENYLWYWLGYVYLCTEKIDEAIKAFQKYTEIDSDDTCAWYYMGSAYQSLRKYTNALEAFKKAIEGKDCDHHKHLSWLGLWNIYLSLFIEEVNKENKEPSLINLRESLSYLPYLVSEKNEVFDSYAQTFKNIIKAKQINVIKTALREIEAANQNDLMEFLSPYATLIKYLETKNREIIDRLRSEERIVVEEMLRMLEDKINEKPIKRNK
ncbi:MAG: tetratricopeptide repeat protein [Nitrospirae bacterium]|nr:tetratricopeptide repeat protein [Nitrospirota bacterium]